MKCRAHLILAASLGVASFALFSMAQADEPAPASEPAPVLAASKPAANGSLLDFKNPTFSGQIVGDGGATGAIAVDAIPQVIKCTYPAMKGYPAVKINAPTGLWDLSGFTGVETSLTNTGTSPVIASLRIDGGDDAQNSPWDCEAVTIPPGQTRAIHVTFGVSLGQSGYKVLPSHVLRAVIFLVNPAEASTLSIKTLKAVK